MAVRSKRAVGKAVASRKKAKVGGEAKRPAPRWGRNDTDLDRKKPRAQAKVTAKKALSKVRKSARAKKP